MLRPFRNSRKRMRVDADHPPPTHDAVNARHRTVQVAARIVETAADPAGDGVEIEMLAAPAARRAFKPRPRLLVPRHQNGVPVDQNVRGVSGELVGIFAPSEPSDRPSTNAPRRLSLCASRRARFSTRRSSGKWAGCGSPSRPKAPDIEVKTTPGIWVMQGGRPMVPPMVALWSLYGPQPTTSAPSSARYPSD